MSPTTALLEGRVVAGHGRRFAVESADGRRLLCLTAGRSLQPVCGDRVRVEATPDGGVIQGLLPRASLFSKADARGRPQPAAANVEQVLVTLAMTPAPELFLLDKYLAAIVGMDIAAGIVFNKADLPAGPEQPVVDERLRYLGTLGYPVFRVSVETGDGMSGLSEALKGKYSLLVGQSGVGKSSLLNALIPGAGQRINELTAATDEGRHTTTGTTLHPLAAGGALLDSPGVRDLALVREHPQELARLFMDLKATAEHCRFKDCLHQREPACAVMAAVEKGLIPQDRYQSYRKLLNTMQRMCRWNTVWPPSVLQFITSR
jgi:ribosome biogenesis GTPase